MRICPSCSYENLPGADSCGDCQTSLTLRDTNPEYSLNSDSKVNTTLGDVDLRACITLGSGDSLAKALEQMRSEDLGCILVVDEGDLVGILTERDILKKVTQPNMDMHSLEIKNFMTSNPEVLTEDDTMAYALNKMAVGRFRHVPIETKGGGYAFFSVRDALFHLF